MEVNLLEPSPEHRREVAENGVTPRTLLRRWAYLAYALVKLAVGAVVVSMAWLFFVGAVDSLGVLPGYTIAVIFILGFIPVGRLFFAWALPVQY